MSFVHLHTHTTFSFGDGACRIPEVVARAAELGMPALAVTDHEGLYGAVRFYQACKAAGGPAWPAPTTVRSHVTEPVSGGWAADARGESSQNGVGGEMSSRAR